jgi:hypothetical protein
MTGTLKVNLILRWNGKKASPNLRRTLSLIVTARPTMPSPASLASRARSRSTASTPSSDESIRFFDRKFSADLIGPRLLEALQENRVLKNDQVPML